MTAWLVPLQETAGQWSEHKDARLGAALAYYSIFSLGPLIVIAVAIAGLAFGTEAVQAQVFGALQGLLGDSGTQAIEAMPIARVRASSLPALRFATKCGLH
jgi:membrane protein